VPSRVHSASARPSAAEPTPPHSSGDEVAEPTPVTKPLTVQVPPVPVSVPVTGIFTPPASRPLSDCTVLRSTVPFAVFFLSLLATVPVLMVTPAAVTVYVASVMTADVPPT